MRNTVVGEDQRDIHQFGEFSDVPQVAEAVIMGAMRDDRPCAGILQTPHEFDAVLEPLPPHDARRPQNQEVILANASLVPEVVCIAVGRGRSIREIHHIRDHAVRQTRVATKPTRWNSNTRPIPTARMLLDHLADRRGETDRVAPPALFVSQLPASPAVRGSGILA
jgi:hypothetical protein